MSFFFFFLLKQQTYIIYAAFIANYGNYAACMLERARCHGQQFRDVDCSSEGLRELRAAVGCGLLRPYIHGVNSWNYVLLTSFIDESPGGRAQVKGDRHSSPRAHVHTLKGPE
eukprot:Colp12_sorted_trinity150504_noHs@19350